MLPLEAELIQFFKKQIEADKVEIADIKNHLEKGIPYLEAIYKAGNNFFAESAFQIIGEFYVDLGMDLEEFYEENSEWHLGQAKCYAFMFARERELDEIGIKLTIEKGEGGSFMDNDNKPMNVIEVTQNYGSIVNFALITNDRYKLSALIMNSKAIDIKSNAIALTEENEIKLTEDNILLARFEKMMWIDSYAPFSGFGTENDPYIILNVEQLSAMAYFINNNISSNGTVPYAKGYYVLKLDLFLTEKFWQPIGTESNPFSGTFDYGDYSIYDLLLDKQYEVTCENGLFGYTKDAIFMHSENNYSSAIWLIVGISSGVLLVILAIVLWIIIKKKQMKKYSQVVEIDNDYLNDRKE